MASALPKCKHAIEIDLSKNGVGDPGALALAAALAAGGAPELLTLDLRGNGPTLTKKGIEALRAVKRKGLLVLADGDGEENEKEGKAQQKEKKGEKKVANDKPTSSAPVSPSSPPSSSSEDDEDDDDEEEGGSSSGDEHGDGDSSTQSRKSGGWSAGSSSSSSSFSPSSPSSLAQNLPPGEAVERLIGEARKALTATAKKKKKVAEAPPSSNASPPPPVLRPRAAAAALFAAGAALAAEAAALAARPGGGLGGATVTVFGTAMRRSDPSTPPAWPPPPGTRLSALPPAARAAAEKAPATLARALDTPPSDGLISSDSDDAPRQRKLACGLPLTPGVGTHRVAAAALVARLLALKCPDADARIAASGALPKVLSLALKHGHCSALQAHALAALRSALESPCEKLWMPLFVAAEEEGGEGGKAAAANGGSGGAAEAPFLLPAALALVVTEATASLLPGMRPTGHAFAVAASAVLLEVSGERRKKKTVKEAEEEEGNGDSSSDSSGTSGSGDKDGKDDKDAAASSSPSASANEATPATPAVRAALSSCRRWLAAAGAEGPLAAVLEEQEDDLCGPRPSRDPPPQQEDSFFGGGGGGGGRIDGQQLLQLLRSMQQL